MFFTLSIHRLVYSLVKVELVKNMCYEYYLCGIACFVTDNSGKTLKDFLEALPREWISEDLMEALMDKGVQLSPTM